MRVIEKSVQPPCCGCGKKYALDHEEFRKWNEISFGSAGWNEMSLYLLCDECSLAFKKIIVEFGNGKS